MPLFAVLSSGATNVHVMSLANVLDVLQVLHYIGITEKEKLSKHNPSATGQIPVGWKRQSQFHVRPSAESVHSPRRQHLENCAKIPITDLKIVRGFCVLGDSVKVTDGNPCALSQLSGIESVLIQAHRPQLPRGHSHEPALCSVKCVCIT